MLSKRSINLDFLKSLGQDQGENVSQALLALENVVVNKVGKLEKRSGYTRLGTRIVGTEGDLTSVRYIAQRQGELLAMSDFGCYKYSGTADRMIKVSSAILTEVEKTSIIRNQYSQSYAQCIKYGQELVTIYQDTRGGYRYSVLDEASNTLIVNDVTLGNITKASLVEFGGKLYLFYVRVADNVLCLKQFLGTELTLSSEVVVENTVVTGQYRIKPYNTNALLIAFVTTGDDLAIGYYDREGNELTIRDAVPNKITITGTYALFDIAFDETTELIYRIGWLDGSNVKYAAYDRFGSVEVAAVTLSAYTNVHSATFSFGDDLFITWDKTASVAQEYLMYAAKVAYNGTITTAKYTLAAGLSLVSEAFIVGDLRYIACCYTSVFQPNIFVISEEGSVIGKFNKDSALQHRTNVELVKPLFDGAAVRIALETRTRLGKDGDFYTETYGISIFNIDYGYETATHIEYNKSLYVSGSILRQYDGASFVEAGFLVRPDENVMTTVSNAVKASGFISSTGKLTFTAYKYGTQGNSISVAFTAGGTAGAEVVTVVGKAISVQIQSGTSTAAQVKTALEASVPAMALITVVVTTGGTMAAPATVTLTGGVGGSMAAGSYQYMACYSWLDNFGDIHRSGMSIPLTYVAYENDSIAVKVPSLYVTEKADVWIEVYRTAAGGTTFHLAGTVPNDITQVYTTFTDTVVDATLTTKELAYTTGDVLNNDSFASCKVLTVADNRLLLGGSESSDEIYYTKEFVPGFGLAPSNALAISTGTKGGDIVALRSFGDATIVFKEELIGVLAGQFALATGIEVSLKFDPLTEEYGCRSKRILEIDKGILFQSQRGLCMLGHDLVSQFVGAPVQDATQSVVTSMALLPNRQEIVILFSDSDAICMNYWAGIWSTFSGHRGYASAMVGNDYYFLDTNDRLLKRETTDVTYTDAGSPVLTRFRTQWYQVGAVAGFQRLYEVVLQGKVVGTHGITVNVYYDFEESPRETLRYNTGTLSAYPIGSIGGSNKILEQLRVQVRDQKCTAVSIEVQEDLPRGVSPSGAVQWHGAKILIGLRSGAYKFDEAKALVSVLTGK